MLTRRVAPSNTPGAPAPVRALVPLVLLAPLVLTALAAAASACGTTTADGGRVVPAVDAGAPPFEGSATVEGGAADGAALPPEGSCERYCAEVVTSCTGPHTMYRSESECRRVCALLEPGRVVEEGNTAGCRERFAGSPARTDPATFCAAAGPFGGGRCGDLCEAFCELALGTCQELAPYPDVPACERACAAYTLDDAGTEDAQPADAAPGPDGSAPASATLDCRMNVLRGVWASNATCADLGDAGPCGAP